MLHGHGFQKCRIIFIDQVIGQGIFKDPAEHRLDNFLRRVAVKLINDLLHVHGADFWNRVILQDADVVTPVAVIVFIIFVCFLFLFIDDRPDFAHGRFGCFVFFGLAVKLIQRGLCLFGSRKASQDFFLTFKGNGSMPKFTTTTQGFLRLLSSDLL